MKTCIESEHAIDSFSSTKTMHVKVQNIVQKCAREVVMGHESHLQGTLHVNEM